MTTKPARVTVRAKGQITLPTRIVQAAGLKEGQMLRVEYREQQDILVLTPVTVTARQTVR
jgi:AbrB family looped-hinge helix DNA binding protein